MNVTFYHLKCKCDTAVLLMAHTHTHPPLISGFSSLTLYMPHFCREYEKSKTIIVIHFLLHRLFCDHSCHRSITGLLDSFFARHTVAGGRQREGGLCLSNLLIGKSANLCCGVTDLVLVLLFFMQRVPPLCHGFQQKLFTAWYRNPVVQNNVAKYVHMRNVINH